MSPVSAASLATAGPHVYKNPNESIAQIHVEAWYVVPDNKVSSTDPDWYKEISDALATAAQFHQLQFGGRSMLNYDIFPQPVYLQNDNEAYDTTSTNDGNPHALINIGEEIERRVLQPGGDLYSAKFAATSTGEYNVMAIFYEGVGASGGMIYDTPLNTPDQIAQQLGLPASIVYIVNINSVNGFFILNQDFLRRPDLVPVGVTTLYHEFAHTIGLPDLFNASDSPLSNDIMGEGRKKAIDDTYIDQSLLQDMGI